MLPSKLRLTFFLLIGTLFTGCGLNSVPKFFGSEQTTTTKSESDSTGLVNGQPATSQPRFEAVVQLINSKGKPCTATRVGPRHFLTAGHCSEGALEKDSKVLIKTDANQEIKGIVGAHNLLDGENYAYANSEPTESFPGYTPSEIKLKHKGEGLVAAGNAQIIAGQKLINRGKKEQGRIIVTKGMATVKDGNALIDEALSSRNSRRKLETVDRKDWLLFSIRYEDVKLIGKTKQELNQNVAIGKIAEKIPKLEGTNNIVAGFGRTVASTVGSCVRLNADWECKGNQLDNLPIYSGLNYAGFDVDFVGPTAFASEIMLEEEKIDEILYNYYLPKGEPRTAKGDSGGPVYQEGTDIIIGVHAASYPSPYKPLKLWTIQTFFDPKNVRATIDRPIVDAMPKTVNDGSEFKVHGYNLTKVKFIYKDQNLSATTCKSRSEGGSSDPDPLLREGEDYSCYTAPVPNDALNEPRYVEVIEQGTERKIGEIKIEPMWPQISTLSLYRGAPTGGYEITVTGTGFKRGAVIVIGDATKPWETSDDRETPATFISSTQLRFTMPKYTQDWRIRTVQVKNVVEVADGSTTGILSNITLFEYLPECISDELYYVSTETAFWDNSVDLIGVPFVGRAVDFYSTSYPSTRSLHLRLLSDLAGSIVKKAELTFIVNHLTQCINVRDDVADYQCMRRPVMHHDFLLTSDYGALPTIPVDFTQPVTDVFYSETAETTVDISETYLRALKGSTSVLSYSGEPLLKVGVRLANPDYTAVAVQAKLKLSVCRTSYN